VCRRRFRHHHHRHHYRKGGLFHIRITNFQSDRISGTRGRRGRVYHRKCHLYWKLSYEQKAFISSVVRTTADGKATWDEDFTFRVHEYYGPLQVAISLHKRTIFGKDRTLSAFSICLSDARQSTEQQAANIASMYKTKDATKWTDRDDAPKYLCREYHLTHGTLLVVLNYFNVKQIRCLYKYSNKQKTSSLSSLSLLRDEKQPDSDAKMREAEPELAVPPVHIAVVTGCHGLLLGLLEYGASRFLEKDRSRSALHMAALFGHTPMINSLLNARAYVMARDSSGRTVFHYAVLGAKLHGKVGYPNLCVCVCVCVCV